MRVVLVPVLIWVLSLCEKHLIGDDPWPYAEVPTQILVEVAARDCDEKILKELTYRGVPVPECFQQKEN